MGNSVLVVHNSDEVFSFLKNTFENEGYTVLHAKDGVQALMSISDKDPSLIVLGEHIPTVNYTDLLSIIKKSPNNSVKCLITENGTSIDTMKLGIDSTLELPLDTDTSKEKLDSLIYMLKLKNREQLQKKKFHQTETFLAHLLEHIRVAIISLDYSGQILSFNRKAQKLWGYQSNFIIGRHFDSLCIHENRKSCSPAVIKETIDNGYYEGVLLFERADGSTFPGNMQTSVIRGDGKDNDEGLVVVIRDLTKQRALEYKLVEKKKLATLGMVVEGVAHEVRNPLISIGGFTRRLQKKVGEDFPYRNYLKVIVDDVTRLESMVKDIESYVHFTKLHRTNFKKGKIDKILEMALELTDKKLLDKINIITEYDPTIPVMYLDIGYLVEMFVNLIENALDAMPSGGDLTITTLRDNNTALKVQITDTGVGIEKSKIGEIFNLFYTTKMSGVGLGLAKVKVIIDEHSGDIEFDSKKGVGTTVTVTLPLERRQKIRR